ncbi:MAG: ATP-binding cassette domain-containing protein [Acetobacteraceae bacterium]|nr:ATP-binding cassette domain-containing protein [Acetobacteraceae bacterium]
MSAPLVQVEGLVKHFTLGGSNILMRSKPVVRAVDGVSFSIAERETLGLVGESGCGKSTVGRLILKLIEPTAGRLSFAGEDLMALPPERLRRMRRDMQIIFQDPVSSLNPRLTVEQIILEPLYSQGARPSAELSRHAAQLLDKVGLPARFRHRYPHQFSGGQRQRIGIARAIATNPRFIVCDEAVSALDVSVQAQVVNLLQDIRDEMGISYLFIGHDLAVVRHISDRIAVMYLGRIVETAPTDRLFTTPLHPYTRALMAAVPIHHPRLRRPRQRLPGELPSPLNPPRESPPLRRLAPGHEAACHLAETFTDAGPTAAPPTQGSPADAHH